MNQSEFGKQQWVEIFRETGLDESMMRRWHQVFEKSAPAAHQSFLEWLHIPSAEIDHIRRESQGR